MAPARICKRNALTNSIQEHMRKVKQKTLAKTIAKIAMCVYNESEPREEEKRKQKRFPAAIDLKAA